MSNLDKEKKDLERAETVFVTTEPITTNVYKVSPEQKEKLDRLAEERIKKAREEAIPKIREQYELRVKEIRQQQQSKADGEGRTPPSKK
ncbi:hypothetical protein [Paenibacillus sp. PL91]|uniref:hypothetical protein n=1 Tax=Paenibacillus sp. PL91 TaxID=2729538 RepID=UPI00145EF5CF|nr:hypothetical protein [Paenibacillus sp. PL91]MBC9204756.1 hypothetical protein [Paenibacillus sp. PL91]